MLPVSLCVQIAQSDKTVKLGKDSCLSLGMQQVLTTLHAE